MSKGLPDLIVKIHWIRIFPVRWTALQQALMIWSTPRQLLAKDPVPQFCYLARPQNPRSMNSSSISGCCVVNGDAATRIQRWPAGCVWGLCHHCTAWHYSEGLRSVGVFLQEPTQRKGLQKGLRRTPETRHPRSPWVKRKSLLLVAIPHLAFFDTKDLLGVKKRKVRYGNKKQWLPSTSNLKCVTPVRQPESQQNQRAIAAIW